MLPMGVLATEEMPEAGELVEETLETEEIQVQEDVPSSDITVPIAEPEEMSEPIPSAEDASTSGTCGENAFWIFDGKGTLTISGTGKIGYYPYGSHPWSANREKIKSIIIRDGITSITDLAFSGCLNATHVTIPASVTSIGGYAFSGCRNLDNVEIPDSVTNIGEYAFNHCEKLFSIIIPQNITTIEKATFYCCYNLANVTIPNGVTTIERAAFAECGLLNLDLPDSVTTIKSTAFYNCRELTNLRLPDSITTLQLEAFWMCTNLYSVTIPKGITNLENAFKDCSQLSRVFIPKGVNTITDHVFNNSDLVDIYYGGNENDWKSININKDNIEIFNANVHYNCTPDDMLSHQYKIYRNGGYEVFDRSVEHVAHKTPSNTYNPQLAHMLIAMCNSVFNEQEMIETFKAFNFEVLDTNYDMWDGIFLGYGVAKKELANGKTLALIVTRGSTDWKEWFSNFDTRVDPSTGQHIGFSDAANELYKRIVSTDLGRDLENTQFVITGFSRGAAVANILAGKLVDQKVAQSQIYTYAFACPDVGVMSENKASSYHCIFNIANISDPVSWIPHSISFGIWNKFGRSYWYSNDWDNYETLKWNVTDFSAHNQVTYLDFLRSEKSVSEYRNRDKSSAALDDAANKRHKEAIKKRRPNISGRQFYGGIFCPVDVEIYTSDGQLAGTVIDNIPNELLPDKVYIDVERDKKHIFLLDNDEYTINLTGTDDGLMEYFVQNIDIDTWDAIEEKNFANVTLNNGKKMVSYINTQNDGGIGADIPNVHLYVLDDNDKLEKEVLPDGNGTEVPITNSYTITFDANGGYVEPSAIATETDGKLLNLPTPTREGYIFNGWFTDVAEGTQITADTVFATDTIVYARWIKDDNKPGDDNKPEDNNKPEDDNSSVNRPIISDKNDKTSNSGENTIENASSSNSEQKKTPRTGDSTPYIWLICILLSLLCQYTVRKIYKH